MYGTSVRIGSCTISFERTLRAPDRNRESDGPLPALGLFPVTLLKRTPLTVGIPIYRREAMRIALESHRRPNAVMIGDGGLNAITGQKWTGELRQRPQNYLVCPGQPWIDGFEAGSTLHLVVFEGREDLKQIRHRPGAGSDSRPPEAAPGERVYRDPHGKRMWDVDRSGTLEVELIPVAGYQERTGAPPPATPVDAKAYASAGLPWLPSYDEESPS